MKFYNLIKTIICNNIFPKLNNSDQNIIVSQVHRILTEIDSKINLMNIYDQLSIESFKDIYILVNMIVPFIEEKDKPNLKNISDIPTNFTNLRYNLPEDYVYSGKDITKNTDIIIKNINKYDLLNKLYVNWIDIFPRKNSDGFLSDIKLAPKYRDKNIKQSQIWRFIEDNIKKNEDEYSKAQYFFSKKTGNNYKTYGDTKLLKELQDIDKHSTHNWMNADTFYWLNQIHFFNHLLENRVIYLTAGTGVGKSTHLPKLAMYGLIGFLGKQNAKIIITQPRQIPAQDVPNYISKNMGYQISEYKEDAQDMSQDNPFFYIQFQHGDDKHISPYTSKHKYLKYVTDQLLYNEIIKNPSLKDTNGDNIYDIVMIDEAHEHNINMDLILTLMNKTLQLNHDIKLVIISATMESDESRYRQFYNNIDDKYENNIGTKSNIDRRLHIANPLQINRYPIVEYFAKTPIDDYVKASIDKIKEISEKSEDGDILLFLTGAADIRNACTILNNEIAGNIIALPLLAMLEQEYKDIVKDCKPEDITINRNDVFLPLAEQRQVPVNTYIRKIIIATAIAEASLTIDTLKYMVNILKTKSNIYNPNEKLQKLTLVPISYSSHTQRRGRVGRTRPGICYYLYTEDEVKNNNIIANITISNLTENILSLLKENKEDENRFSKEELEDLEGNFYIVHPSDYGYKLKRTHHGLFTRKLDIEDNKNINDAFDYLLDLNLIDKDGYKTDIGKFIPTLLSLNKIPIESRLFLTYGVLAKMSKYTVILDSFTRTGMGKFSNFGIYNNYKPFFDLWSNKSGDHYAIINIVSNYLKQYPTLFITKYGKKAFHEYPEFDNFAELEKISDYAERKKIKEKFDTEKKNKQKEILDNYINQYNISLSYSEKIKMNKQMKKHKKENEKNENEFLNISNKNKLISELDKLKRLNKEKIDKKIKKNKVKSYIDKIIAIETSKIDNWCKSNYINTVQFVKFLENMNFTKLQIKEIEKNIVKSKLNLSKNVKDINYSNWFDKVVHLYQLSYPRNIALVNDKGIYSTKFHIPLYLSNIRTLDKNGNKIYSKPTTYNSYSNKIFFNNIIYNEFVDGYEISYITKLN